MLPDRHEKMEHVPIQEILSEMHAAMIAVKYFQLRNGHFHLGNLKVCGAYMVTGTSNSWKLFISQSFFLI